MAFCASCGDMYYAIANFSNNCVSKYLWELDESTITNIFSLNGINTLLNVDNDMDAAIILCRNTWVSNTVSVCTEFRVAS